MSSKFLKTGLATAAALAALVTAAPMAAQAQANLAFVERLMSVEDLEEARATPLRAGAAP